jgi:uncharacterized protein
VRCLDPVELDLEVDLQELYYYPDIARKRSDEEEDVLSLEGDLLDLEPSVRDAVVLALPFQPLCAVDCPGLCATCGARLAEEPTHRHEVVDTRWAALAVALNGSDTAYAPDRPSGGSPAADAKQER